MDYIALLTLILVVVPVLLVLIYIDQLMISEHVRHLADRLYQQLRVHAPENDAWSRIYTWYRLLHYIETHEANTRERARLTAEIRRRIRFEKRSL